MSGSPHPRARMFLKTSKQPRLATASRSRRRSHQGAQEGRKGGRLIPSAPDQKPTTAPGTQGLDGEIEADSVTFPQLMEMCHKGQELPATLFIRSHKPGVGKLAVLKTCDRDALDRYSLRIELVQNYDDLTDLPPDMIVNSFAEAGITLTINRLGAIPLEEVIGGARVVHTDEERQALSQAAMAEKVQAGPTGNGGKRGPGNRCFNLSPIPLNKGGLFRAPYLFHGGRDGQKTKLFL